MDRSGGYTGYDEERHLQYARKHNLAANLCGMCVQNTPGNISFYACCWQWACGQVMKDNNCFNICPCLVPCVVPLVESR